MGWKYDETKHTYALEKEDQLDIAIKRIRELQLANLVIQNDDDYKALYECRTQINAYAKEIATYRKQMVKVVTGQFQYECKLIENACIEATNEMTERLNAYRPKKERAKTSYKMVIKVDNPKAFDKIHNYALKYGAEVEISK